MTDPLTPAWVVYTSDEWVTDLLISLTHGIIGKLTLMILMTLGGHSGRCRRYASIGTWEGGTLNGENGVAWRRHRPRYVKSSYRVLPCAWSHWRVYRRVVYVSPVRSPSLQVPDSCIESSVLRLIASQPCALVSSFQKSTAYRSNTCPSSMQSPMLWYLIRSLSM